MSNQIRCIRKEHRNNPYERITHIGWINSENWNKWQITQKEAIDAIEANKWDFHVIVWWDRANVIVSTSRYWNKYIKTINDWDEPNNLLSLPECK